MKTARILWVVLSLLLFPEFSSAKQDIAAMHVDPPGAAAHVKRARQIAGSDLKYHAEGILSQPAEFQIPYALANIPYFLDPKAPAVEPFQAFDNLYYFGLYAIGAWLLDTGDGLILFDALNNEAEVKNILLPGMAKFGLDPKDIKYLVITHAHFDHYGGAQYLKENYGMRILMSAEDWDNLANDIALPYAIKAGYPPVTPPERDWEVENGFTLKLGDSSVTFLVTPGHTPGTLSPIMSVKDRGRTLNIGMWGGNALHADFKLLGQMHDSLHVFWAEARKYQVESLISTHPFVTGNFRAQERGRDAAGNNPHILGKDGVDRYLSIIDELIHAQFARSASNLE